MRSTSNTGLPEVGGDHVRLAHHRARIALGDDAAVTQHDDAVGQLQHGAYDVLDEDDGRSARADLADQADRGVDLGVSEAGEHFVEKEQVRARSERAGQLEEFLWCRLSSPGSDI